MKSILKKYKVNKLIINNGDSTSNILNNFPIYVINLEKDIYRRSYIKHLFETLKINYNLIIVNNVTPDDMKKWNINQKFRNLGQFGCILSHMYCLEDAIKNNYEKFMIFEDDIIFHKNFDNLISKYLTYDLDLLMLGGTDFELKNNIVNMNNNNDLYFPQDNVLGAFANVYSLNFAKHLYDYKIRITKISEFDKEYYLFYNDFKIGVCYPNIVIVELSTTNIDHVFSPDKKPFYDEYIEKCYMGNLNYINYNYISIDFVKFVFENKLLNQCNDYIDIVNLYINSNYKYLLNKNKIEYMLVNSDYTIEDLKKICLKIKQEITLLSNDDASFIKYKKLIK
jgi:GR25 family glycosyltransferase involved in LPS biosynthesis